jgi:hypothetical protein
MPGRDVRVKRSINVSLILDKIAKVGMGWNQVKKN